MCMYSPCVYITNPIQTKRYYNSQNNLVWLVWVHSILTSAPAVGLKTSISSFTSLVKEKTNRQPLAEPVAANTQYRETVVLKKDILALWTLLVTVGRERRGMQLRS